MSVEESSHFEVWTQYVCLLGVNFTAFCQILCCRVLNLGIKIKYDSPVCKYAGDMASTLLPGGLI